MLLMFDIVSHWLIHFQSDLYRKRRRRRSGIIVTMAIDGQVSFAHNGPTSNFLVVFEVVSFQYKDKDNPLYCEKVFGKWTALSTL